MVVVETRQTIARAWPWRSLRVLWAWCWALHGAFALALLPTMLAGESLGDLPLYREWAERALAGGSVMGVDEPWVYPLLAWLPIGAAGLAGPGFLVAWLAMTTALDAAALRAIVGHGHPARLRAGVAWLAVLLVLCPVGLLRLEGITAPVVVIALAWLARRPRVAGSLLAIATWIKVWPAVVVAAVVLLRRQRWIVARSGLLVTAGVVVLAATLGGTTQLTSFLAMQSGRALQLEAPIATPWVWMAMLGVPGSGVYQNLEIATREVVGPLDGAALLLSTPLMAIACAAALALGAAAVHRGASRADVVLVASLAMTAALFVGNRVGSPQYMLWMLPIAVVGMRTGDAWWTRVTRVLLVTAALTTAVFPIAYMPLIDGEPWAVLLLTARNALLVAAAVMAFARLAGLAGLGPLGAAPPSRSRGLGEPRDEPVAHAGPLVDEDRVHGDVAPRALGVLPHPPQHALEGGAEAHDRGA